MFLQKEGKSWQYDWLRSSLYLNTTAYIFCTSNQNKHIFFHRLSSWSTAFSFVYNKLWKHASSVNVELYINLLLHDLSYLILLTFNFDLLQYIYLLIKEMLGKLNALAKEDVDFICNMSIQQLLIKTSVLPLVINYIIR